MTYGVNNWGVIEKLTKNGLNSYTLNEIKPYVNLMKLKRCAIL
ncbi:hypothetical protein GCWU000282_01248 [Catonella morbi ATCC 51271]|uniref:Uncharacterized protein n=1 Tax=Catonella morbi ATCC 51271 TaxID=592026 RepID=V2Y768_9FIRM|nr:hypothetical protein GCWU000282_01248 [Catonella morbi ATCC 51271]